MATITLELSTDQLARIAAALAVTAPSGGGSRQWSTFLAFSRQVESQVGADLDYTEHQMDLIEVVLDEAVEAGVVERLN